MSQKNKPVLLFIPSYKYLTDKIYFAMLPELHDFRTVYLDAVRNDEEYNTPDYFEIKKEILRKFGAYVKLILPYRRDAPFFERYIIGALGLASRNFISDFILYFKLKRTLESYLSELHPVAVVTSTDWRPLERMVIQWCKRRGVPYIIHMTTFTDEAVGKLTFQSEFKRILWNKLLRLPIAPFRSHTMWGHEDINATHLFLWSRHFAPDFKRKNLHFTGDPFLDQFFVQFSPKRVIRNNILVCTECLDGAWGLEALQQVNAIYKYAFQKRKSISFTIKVHPREPITKYQRIFPQEEFPNVKVTKDNLYELFKISDAQVAVYSTSLFQGAASGVPIITIQLEPKYHFVDHFKGDINLVARNGEELVESIDRILSNDFWVEFIAKREKYFKKMVTFADGRNASRFATELRQIISKQKEHKQE